MTIRCHPGFLPRFSFLLFEVVIWGPGRGMEFSNPTRTKTTTRETDNKKAIFNFSRSDYKTMVSRITVVCSKCLAERASVLVYMRRNYMFMFTSSGSASKPHREARTHNKGNNCTADIP